MVAEPKRCSHANEHATGHSLAEIPRPSVAPTRTLGTSPHPAGNNYPRSRYGGRGVPAGAGSGKSRWIGILGNPKHEGPHVDALRARNVPDAEIARVHRPVGLNIGSRTPAEIAVATLAGLIADRNRRPGGFDF